VKHVIVGKIEGRIVWTGRCKQLLDVTENERILEVESGSTRLHSGELLWKRLWTC
jgi:hypothetical protein